MKTDDLKEMQPKNLKGAYGELVGLIGTEAVLKIYEAYRGTQMFFPVELYTREYIRNQIVSEYDGKNIRYLATKYGYTEKWIRKFLKESKGEENGETENT